MREEPTAKPLAPDVGALLMELAAALNRRGMYPPGHPALGNAARAVADKAAGPLESRGEVILAVARDRFIHGDEQSDPAHPVLRDLADRLHRGGVGGLRFGRGFGEDGAGALLDALASQPEDGAASAAPWRGPGCELAPTRYDRLALADDVRGSSPGAAVWGDLARSAMGGEARDGVSAGDLARAINERTGDAAYDGAVAARLTGLLRRVGSASPELAPDLAELLRTLDPSRLRRLLQLAGDAAPANEILRLALKALPADAVLALLKAARGPQQSISDSLMRILAKLSAHAPDPTPDGSGATADAALREQVEQLVSGWELEDPNPDEYTEALQALAAHRAGRPSVPSAESRPGSVRVVGMALELGATGPVFSRALDDMSGRDPRGLVRLLSAAPAAEGNPALAQGWKAMLTPQALAGVLAEAEPADESVEALLTRAGDAAIGPLLDRLADSDDRAQRRWVLERLAALGSSVGPAAAARLGDAPWYLARNLLYLMRQAHAQPDFPPEPWLGHDDPRVRVEAVRLFALGAGRERVLVGALRDDDPAVVSAGLALAADACPPAAVPLLARRATDPDLPEDVRAQAVRVAATYPTDGGRDALRSLVVTGRTLFLRRLKFADPTPLSMAALSALLRGWPEDDGVAELRTAARSAKHGAIRAAARETA